MSEQALEKHERDRTWWRHEMERLREENARLQDLAHELRNKAAEDRHLACEISARNVKLVFDNAAIAAMLDTRFERDPDKPLSLRVDALLDAHKDRASDAEYWRSKSLQETILARHNHKYAGRLEVRLDKAVSALREIDEANMQVDDNKWCLGMQRAADNAAQALAEIDADKATTCGACEDGWSRTHDHECFESDEAGKEE